MNKNFCIEIEDRIKMGLGTSLIGLGCLSDMEVIKNDVEAYKLVIKIGDTITGVFGDLFLENQDPSIEQFSEELNKIYKKMCIIAEEKLKNEK